MLLLLITLLASDKDINTEMETEIIVPVCASFSASDSLDSRSIT